MNRHTAVSTWRAVCGSDAVMASMIVTGRMLEDFATRIELLVVAAERERCAKLCEDSDIFDYGDPGGFFADLIRKQA